MLLLKKISLNGFVKKSLLLVVLQFQLLGQSCYSFSMGSGCLSDLIGAAEREPPLKESESDRVQCSERASERCLGTRNRPQLNLIEITVLGIQCEDLVNLDLPFNCFFLSFM